jgi:acyl carrier protein
MGLKEAELKKAIFTEDGLNAFARSLNSDLQQIIVSPEDLFDANRRSGQAPKYEKDRGGDWNSENANTIGFGKSGELDQPTNEIENAVARIWMDVFGHKRIGIHQQFFALGGHSLMAMQIVTKVRAAYQIDFSLREFFSVPTISQLSDEISSKINREIENLSDDEARQLIQTIKVDENS